MGATSEKLAECGIVDAIQQLGHAAETGDVERVACLLGEGVPVDARNTVGRPRTALDRAIWAEQTDVVRLLLASGADPDQEINGSTDAASWISPADLREPMLSPAALDGLRMLGYPAVSA